MKVRGCGSILLLTLTVTAGCGHPLGVGRAWIDGEWIYQAEMVGDEGACEITGLVLSLDQEGDSFAGVAEGVLFCSIFSIPVTRSLSGSPITGGRSTGGCAAIWGPVG